MDHEKRIVRPQVSNPRAQKERMPHLLDVPARYRWVSLKPFIC